MTNEEAVDEVKQSTAAAVARELREIVATAINGVRRWGWECRYASGLGVFSAKITGGDLATYVEVEAERTDGARLTLSERAPLSDVSAAVMVEAIAEFLS